MVSSRLQILPENGQWGLGSNIGRGLFVGWGEYPDIFCWVSFLYPTYLPTIFVLSAKPNKMAEDRIIPGNGMGHVWIWYWRKAGRQDSFDQVMHSGHIPMNSSLCPMILKSVALFRSCLIITSKSTGASTTRSQRIHLRW